MLAAFTRLVRERPASASQVVLSCTCDEESTSLGVNDLTRLWTDASRAGSLLSRRPDVAIVAEPTQLDIVVAHRGATRWKIKTAGRACHSSAPENGINAIYRMARVVAALEQYAARLPALITPHPLCGPATLSVGRIEGGISVNTVPDWCAVEIDRRVVPGEDGWRVMDDVMAWLREQLDFPVEFLPPWIVGMSLPDDDNGPLADELLERISELVKARRKVGVPYGTHASRIAAAGVPSVVFGPGDIAQAHTVDEWIEIDQLRLATEVYYRFCAT
jgi:acetylornithine deacetylase